MKKGALAYKDSRNRVFIDEYVYKKLFDNSSDAIIIADARSRRLIDCNAQAMKLTGYSRRELLSMRADQLHPRDMRDLAMRHFSIMSAGRSRIVSSCVLTKTGGRVAVSISSSLAVIGQKKLLLGIFRDVSQRQRLEERASYLAKISEEDPNPVMRIGMDKKILYANPPAKNMLSKLGIGEKDLIPSRWWKYLNKTMSTGRMVANVESSTSDKIYSWTGMPVTKSGYVNVYGTDITERKRAEEMLRQTSSLLAATIESIFNGILVVDRKGKVVQYNRMFAKMWNIPKYILRSGDDSRMLKYVLKQLVDPMSFLKKIKYLYNRPGQESYDLLEFKDGKVFERYSRPQFVASKIVGRVWTFHDITLHKKAEGILKRDTAKLNQLVRSRSAELLAAQNDLNKTKRFADIGLLASTIAHELRSPFAVIRTAAYNIRVKSMDPRLESHLANIDKKILESDQIIKNLLYYSSIKTPHCETFYFCKLIDDCVELSQRMFAPHKVSIKKIYKCGMDLEAEGDPIQLGEVFNNLINNARESLGEKNGRIEIKTEADKRHINVMIRDNGSGIDPKYVGKIFEPFFTTKVKGMGLGLSLCSQIISLHNGTIKVDSKPGKGTVVKVSLPKNA